MAGNADEWTSTVYAPYPGYPGYPGAPAEVPSTEGWAFDRHVTRGGAFRHDRDLARCARRHGAYEPDLEAIGVGFRPAAPAAYLCTPTRTQPTASDASGAGPWSEE